MHELPRVGKIVIFLIVFLFFFIFFFLSHINASGCRGEGGCAAAEPKGLVPSEGRLITFPDE